MLKRFFELLGLATMGVGLYFIVSEHRQNNVCNATEGKLFGLGVNATCQHIVYVYFGGFILLTVGALTVIFGLLASRRASKRRSSQRHSSLASQYHRINPEDWRTPQS